MKALPVAQETQPCPLPWSFAGSSSAKSRIRSTSCSARRTASGAFPIVIIGLFEAHSINRRVKGEPSPRPLTHDLIVGIIESLQGEVQDIIISELKEHTYYAKLRVRQEGELMEIDCRPSDAIAIAVTARVPIFVNEEVLGDTLDI